MKYLKIYEEYSGTMRRIASGYGWNLSKDDGTGLYYFDKTDGVMYREYDSMLKLINKKDININKFIEILKSYEFQKNYIIEHPERIDDLKKFGYAEGIQEEFKHLFVGKEWGFFDLKENLNETLVDYGFVIASEGFWSVCIKNGELYLIWIGTELDYIVEQRIMEEILNGDFSAGAKARYEKLNTLLKRIKSYEFQKEYLTKYPERTNDIKQIGINDKIKEEFKHLFVGKEWGFFDLKESLKLKELKKNLFLTRLDLGTAHIENIKMKTELIDICRNIFSSLYKLYRTENGKYIITYMSETFINSNNTIVKEDKEWIIVSFDSKSSNQALQKFLRTLRSYKLQKKWIEKYPERIPELRDFGFNEKIKKEYPSIVRGSEWGFFDLERSSI